MYYSRAIATASLKDKTRAIENVILRDTIKSSAYFDKEYDVSIPSTGTI